MAIDKAGLKSKQGKRPQLLAARANGPIVRNTSNRKNGTWIPGQIHAFGRNH
jgi:hypothetical protein